MLTKGLIFAKQKNYCLKQLFSAYFLFAGKPFRNHIRVGFLSVT
jgi:hypothetical protein